MTGRGEKAKLDALLTQGKFEQAVKTMSCCYDNVKYLATLEMAANPNFREAVIKHADVELLFDLTFLTFYDGKELRPFKKELYSALLSRKNALSLISPYKIKDLLISVVTDSGGANSNDDDDSGCGCTLSGFDGQLIKDLLVIGLDPNMELYGNTLFPLAVHNNKYVIAEHICSHPNFVIGDSDRAIIHCKLQPLLRLQKLLEV